MVKIGSTISVSDETLKILESKTQDLRDCVEMLATQRTDFWRNAVYGLARDIQSVLEYDCRPTTYDVAKSLETVRRKV